MNKKLLIGIGITLIAIFFAIKYRHKIWDIIQQKLISRPEYQAYQPFGDDAPLVDSINDIFIDDILEGC